MPLENGVQWGKTSVSTIKMVGPPTKEELATCCVAPPPCVVKRHGGGFINRSGMPQNKGVLKGNLICKTPPSVVLFPSQTVGVILKLLNKELSSFGYRERCLVPPKEGIPPAFKKWRCSCVTKSYPTFGPKKGCRPSW